MNDINSKHHHESCFFAGQTFGETNGSPSHCSCVLLNEYGPDGVRTAANTYETPLGGLTISRVRP